MHIEAFDLFYADHSFMFSLVGQHRWTRNIADGVNSSYIGLAIAVRYDDALVRLYAQPFKAKLLDVACDANGGDDLFNGDLLFGPLSLDGRRNGLTVLP